MAETYMVITYVTDALPCLLRVVLGPLQTTVHRVDRNVSACVVLGSLEALDTALVVLHADTWYIGRTSIVLAWLAEQDQPSVRTYLVDLKCGKAPLLLAEGGTQPQSAGHGR